MSAIIQQPLILNYRTYCRSKDMSFEHSVKQIENVGLVFFIFSQLKTSSL